MAALDLITMARTSPEISVTVRLRDLLEANETLARRVWSDATMQEEQRRRNFGDSCTLVPKEEARQMLGAPDRSTMWRWEKSGYLVPVKIGGRLFYRSGDIAAIIEKHSIKYTHAL